MGQTMSCFGTEEPAEKPSKDVKFLTKLEKALKKHPTISDDEWQKVGTKICKNNSLYEMHYVPIVSLQDGLEYY